MSLLDPRTWLALSLALLAAYGSGRWQQWRADEREHIAEMAEANAKAFSAERAWQLKTQEIANAKDAEIRRVAAARDAAVRELRDRPERLPEPSRAACAGSTGAELSGRDAEFLVGLAARADELRAALGACQAREQVK